MSGERKGLHYGWIVLGMGLLVVFGSLGLARFSYSVLLPDMQAALGMDNTEAGVLATANLVGYLVLSLVGGALASRFGPRAVVAVGLGLAGLGMVLTSVAGSFASAAVWRALSGIGSGASNVPVMGLWAGWFAARRRGLAAGVAVSGSSVAIILVGPLVPRVLEAYGAHGWRICWGVFGAVTLALALCSYLVLRNHPSEKGLGAVGAAEGEVAPARKAGGLAWGRVYRSRAVWMLGLVYVAFGFSYIIYMTFFSKCLIADGGYSQAEAGRLFMLIGWFSLLCGLVWGAVSDVIGREYAMGIVYVIQAVAFSLFALWPTPVGFTLSAVLFGLTAWSVPAIMAAACGDVLGPQLAPAGLGFITLFFGVGQALGPSVAGAMADAADSLKPAFLLAGGVAMLGALGCLALHRLAGGREKAQGA